MLVEAVVTSLEEAVLAGDAGVDRLELCAALELGGLTPSFGLFAQVRDRVAVPAMVMVRPRAGAFVYGPSEWETMLADVDMFAAYGAAGMVTGVSRADGTLHVPRMAALRARAPRAEWVCHRAFDLTPDPFTALEQLIDLGFHRVLTSGHGPRAADRPEHFRSLLERANGRIEILAAGGLRLDNVAPFLRASGVTQIHLAPQMTVSDGMTGERNGISFALSEPLPEGVLRRLDPEHLRKVCALKPA